MSAQHLTVREFFEDENLPIRLIRRNPQEPYPLHTHQFFELVVIFGGRGVHFTEKSAYEVQAGDAFVIQGDRAHGYRDLDNLVLVNILFDMRKMQLPMADLRNLPGYHALFALEPLYRDEHGFESRLRLTSEQLEHVAGLTEMLERETAAKEPAYAFHCTAAFMQIIGYLSRCYSQAQAPSLQPLLRMGSVIGYLEERYASPIALQELARVAHMSRSSLQRFFKRSTGCSPVAYLIRLRVQKACELLRSGDQTVTEIAFRVGFTDSNYFARQFSRIMGESPRDYRRRTVLPRK